MVSLVEKPSVFVKHLLIRPVAYRIFPQRAVDGASLLSLVQKLGILVENLLIILEGISNTKEFLPLFGSDGVITQACVKEFHSLVKDRFAILVAQECLP